mgnify:CR=1 FL=1
MVCPQHAQQLLVCASNCGLVAQVCHDAHRLKVEHLQAYSANQGQVVLEDVRVPVSRQCNVHHHPPMTTPSVLHQLHVHAGWHDKSQPGTWQLHDAHTFCLLRASVASLRARWFCPSHLLVVMQRLASNRSQNSSVCT